MNKKAIALIIFVTILSLFTTKVYSILKWKDNAGIRQFYEYDENTMDVIAYGSSHTYCTINTSLLWEDYGMAAYNMGESGQNFGSTYYYIKESLKRQNPKVLLVEVRFLAAVDEGLKNGNLYRNTLGMKYSKDYIDNTEYAISQSTIQGMDKNKYWQYLILKFPVFHSRYAELTQKDYVETDITQGRYVGSWTSEEYDTPAACINTGIVPLTEEQTKWLDKVWQLAEKNNIELVLWVAPYILSDIDMMQYNAVKEYSRQHGIPFFNFNEMYQEIQFDYGTDMRNENHAGGHLNNFGAEKVTSFLGKYIYDNYDVPDRRGDISYNLYHLIDENWLANVEQYNNGIMGQ